MDAALRLLVISGSISPRSHTRVAASAIGHLLRMKGADVIHRDVAEPVLPIADPAYHHAPENHPDARVRELSAAFDAADGVVLASPVYHGSYSGVLKNLLDHLRPDALRGKPVGLVVHGGGARTGAVVCEHLRCVVRTLYGYPTRTQAVTCKADYRLVDGGPQLASEEIALRLDGLAAEIVLMAKFFQQAPVIDDD